MYGPQGLKDLMKNVIHSDGKEDLNFPEALAAYTINAAYAAGEGFEDKMGRLSIGYTADFILTDIDGWEIRPDDEIKVGTGSKPEVKSKVKDMSEHIMKTFVGGVCVYDIEKEGKNVSDYIVTGPDGPGKSGRPLWSCPCCT